MPGEEGSSAGIVLLKPTVEVLHEGVKLVGVEGGHNAGNIRRLGGREGINHGLGVLVLEAHAHK